MSEQATAPELPVAAPRTEVGARRSASGAAPGARGIVRSTCSQTWRAVVWGRSQLWGGVREGFVETAGLHPGVRRLIVFGYALILVLLAVLLTVDVFRDASWMPLFNSQVTGGSVPNGMYRMPIPALTASVVAYVVGWAYVLTGASDCGRRVFVATLVVFGLPLWLVARATAEAVRQPMLPFVGAVTLAILVPAVLHVVTHRSRVWRERPGVELAIWTAVPCLLLAGFSAVLAANGVSDGRLEIVSLSVVTYLFFLCANWMLVAGTVFSMWLAPEPVNMGVDAGRALARRLRRWLRPSVFGWVALGATLLPALIVALPGAYLWSVFHSLAAHEIVISITLLAGPLALVGWALQRRLAGRWSPLTATIGLALAVAALLTIGLFVLATFANQDLLGWVLAASGLIPPVLLFVLLSTYSVMTFGARFANRDGQQAPRTGRTLIFFGVVMLMMGGMLFSTNLRLPDGRLSTAFQDRLDLTLLVTMWIVAPPYLVWTALRRPNRLLGRIDVRAQPRRRGFARYLPGRLSFGDVALFALLVALSLGATYLGAVLTP